MTFHTDPEAFQAEYEDEQAVLTELAQQSAAITVLENAKIRLEKSLSFYQGRDWDNPGAQSICKQLDMVEAALVIAKGEEE